MANAQTGIEANVRFFPLAWFLFFCTPKIEIDGTVFEKSWGTHFFPLAEGRHTVKIWFMYFFSRCGMNSIDVQVTDGRVSRISYYMPPWMFAKGSLKEEESTVVQERTDIEASTAAARNAVPSAIKQKLDELIALRQQLAPAKRHRKRVVLLSMIGGAFVTGTPTFIVFSEAGLFASLVGLGLGFLGARIFFLLNSAERGVSANLRSEERLFEEIRILQQKSEQRSESYR